MIYYIIAVDRKTGNEWVMSTHDSVVTATEKAAGYRANDDRFGYRIDTVDVPRAEQDLHRFTARELFPPGNGITTSDCVECGSYVRITKQNLHAEWHNKIADL